MVAFELEMASFLHPSFLERFEEYLWKRSEKKNINKNTIGLQCGRYSFIQFAHTTFWYRALSTFLSSSALIRRPCHSSKWIQMQNFSSPFSSFWLLDIKRPRATIRIFVTNAFLYSGKIYSRVVYWISDEDRNATATAFFYAHMKDCFSPSIP
jgi:hypothetical protein